MTRHVNDSLHIQRLQQIPPGQLYTAPELKGVWDVTNPLPTIRYLLDRGLLHYRRLEPRWRRAVYAYYRAGTG